MGSRSGTRAGPIGFQVLNITFISPGQMLLVWLTTAPMHQLGCGARRRSTGSMASLQFVLGVARSANHRRRTDVALPAGQETSGRGGRGNFAAVHDDRPIRSLPTPELLLRNGDVAGLLPVCGGGFRPVAAFDRARVHSPHRARHPVYAAGRVHLGEQIPGLSGLPEDAPSLNPLLRLGRAKSIG